MLKHFIEIMRGLEVWIVHKDKPQKAKVNQLSTASGGNHSQVHVIYIDKHNDERSEWYKLEDIFYSESGCLKYLKECEEARHKDRMDQLCKLAVK